MKINQNLAISESGFLFNPSSGESFTVNPIGAEIINLFKEGLTPGEISLKFTNAYDVDKTTFEKDLHDFSDILKQHQLLEEDDETKA